MTDPGIIAAWRYEAFQHLLKRFDLDIPIPSTKQPVFEQQLFETKIMEAILARVEALEAAVADAADSSE